MAEPLPGSPMIVFVNCKSGGGHGERFLRRFKQILNPGQVFDIANEGPTFGLEVYRYLAPLHLLVCGGDGSVGWVLKEIDQLQHKAIYAISTSGATEVAVIRTGGYVNYGFGGYIYQRNNGNSVVIPVCSLLNF